MGKQQTEWQVWLFNETENIDEVLTDLSKKDAIEQYNKKTDAIELRKVIWRFMKVKRLHIDDPEFEWVREEIVIKDRWEKVKA